MTPSRRRIGSAHPAVVRSSGHSASGSVAVSRRAALVDRRGRSLRAAAPPAAPADERLRPPTSMGSDGSAISRRVRVRFVDRFDLGAGASSFGKGAAPG